MTRGLEGGAVFHALPSWAFATFNGRKCLVIGFRDGLDGSIDPVITMVPSGELLVVEFGAVKMDLKKVVDLTARPLEDEWKGPP